MQFYAAGLRGVLLADDMGLGKTAQALDLIDAMVGVEHALVICPSSVKLNWLKECDVWLKEPRVRHLMNGRGLKVMTPGFKMITVANYDILDHSDFTGAEYDLVVFDEAHYLKNMKAKRTKAAHAIPAAKRLLLTGTPIVNRPMEIFSLLLLCGVVTKSQEHAFGLKYCAGYQEWIYIPGGNGKKKKVWNYDGASNLEELNTWLRQLCMIRRMKVDVLKDLPPMTRQLIELSTKRKAKKYDASILDGDIKVAFEEYSLVRHEQALDMLPQFIEIVENELRATDKLFVAFHHRDIGLAVRDALDHRTTTMVMGGLTSEQKQAEVDCFINDPSVKVFLGQIQSSGTGTDGLQRVCSNMLVLEFPWDPGTRDQLEARVDRNGQTMPVLIKYLVQDGSLAARMAKTILRKEVTVNKAVN